MAQKMAANVDIWAELGFRQNPYQTTPLRSDDEGAHLLVGRDREVERLGLAITRGAAHAVLEGQSGVGKTSLIAVVAQTLRHRRRDHPDQAPFFPLKRALNVTSGTTSTEIVRDATRAIAKELLTVEQELGRSESSDALQQVNQWLSQATFVSRGGGASALGFGATASRATQANTSAGFDQSGIVTIVLDALDAYFPSLGSGGVVAVLENVELAGGPEVVQELLEGMRDPLFTCPGLRWVVSGAGDAVRRACGSSRLDGIIGPPIQLRPVEESDAGEVVERRLEWYRTRGNPDVPVDGEGFRYLFRVARGNLRTALRYSDEFSTWAYQTDVTDAPPDERAAVLRSWLLGAAETRLTELDPIDRPMWRVFDELTRWPDGVVEIGDAVGAGGREYLELERRGLIELDAGSSTVRVTRLGWLIAEIPVTRRA